MKLSWGVVKYDFKRNWMIYAMAMAELLVLFEFCYGPLWGVLISFFEYKSNKGLFGSAFVGLKHFNSFLTDPFLLRLVQNTFVLNIWGLVFGFPAPIILALMLNEVKNEPYKRLMQTVSYMPHFISLVVLCGMINIFSSSEGLFNTIIALFGGERSPLLANAELFRPIYTFSGVWQGVGWGSIIYMAAMAGISPELYESAVIDGAGRIRRIISITLPGIAPTVIIMFIFAIGGLMSSSYEKVILLYNPLTYETADVIASYVYRRGLREFNYSYSTAVGLINSAVNFIFIWFANRLSKRYSETSLW